jgi:hypothetical protein
MAVEMVDTTFPFYREASSPCGRQPGSRPARTRRLSRSTKPLRHQGPEQRSRKLPKLLSRVRHGTETHRVTKEGTPLWSLMSELPHPGQADRTTDLPTHVGHPRTPRNRAEKISFGRCLGPDRAGITTDGTAIRASVVDHQRRGCVRLQPSPRAGVRQPAPTARRPLGAAKGALPDGRPGLLKVRWSPGVPSFAEPRPG